MSESVINLKCGCGGLQAYFSVSLLPQPWMRDRKHATAVRCLCGKNYLSLATDEIHESAQPAAPAAGQEDSNVR